MPRSKVSFDFDEYYANNSSYGSDDSGVFIQHKSLVSPSRGSLKSGEKSVETFQKQIKAIKSSCDVLLDNAKKLRERPKTRDQGCQTDESGYDPILMDRCETLMHESHDLKHELEFYKEKCREQAATIACQNKVLCGQEEIVEQLTSMFNQRLDQLREEYNQKAQNFVAKDLPKVPPSGDQLLLETQIDYLHAQNKQLRRELHRDTTGSCSTSFEGAFTDSSPKSKSRGRDQPKSPNPLINFYQSLKRSKSFRRRSD